MAACLKDAQRGADLIITFAAKQGITINPEEVIAFVDDVDEVEWNIDLTPEILTNISGGKRC